MESATPNVVIENPDKRRIMNKVISTAAIVVGTAIVLDAATPEFDITAYTLPASAVVVYLAGAFGFGVTIPNIPKR